MIDSEGFRPNVGIVLFNEQGKLFWARRIGMNAWQFPQGGIHEHETPEQTLYRELKEEIGLRPEDVEIVASSKSWLKYYLPRKYLRTRSLPLCIGQKQKWYLLKMIGPEQQLSLRETTSPEFDHWRWVHYWLPLRQVVYFKRAVYRQVLNEFAPLVLNRNPQ